MPALKEPTTAVIAHRLRSMVIPPEHKFTRISDKAPPERKGGSKWNHSLVKLDTTATHFKIAICDRLLFRVFFFLYLCPRSPQTERAQQNCCKL